MKIEGRYGLFREGVDKKDLTRYVDYHRAVFSWLSKVIKRLLSLGSVIGLKISRQFFNQWEANPESIMPCTRDFSRALSKLRVNARNSDWLIAIFALVVIDLNNDFGFGFSPITHLRPTLKWSSPRYDFENTLPLKRVQRRQNYGTMNHTTRLTSESSSLNSSQFKKTVRASSTNSFGPEYLKRGQENLKCREENKNTTTQN